MLKKTFLAPVVLALLISSFSSCVGLKKYQEEQQRVAIVESEKEQLKNKIRSLEVANNELEGKFRNTEKKMKALQSENNSWLSDFNRMKKENEQLTKFICELEEQQKALQSGSSREIRKLISDLQATQNDLLAREDKLKASESALQANNQRLMELERILREKDQAVNDLKNKVMNALTGYQKQGLTVYEKNGKVYVSLEERLLFKTGQYIVDTKGKNALRELSNVLAENPDINIMVEGHTDDVPLRGTGTLKDNWDLSVMRATAVTRFLLNNKKIDPKRIIASGRSEYIPLVVEKTMEARRKNRRTEIILTPNLDEVLRILGSD